MGRVMRRLIRRRRNTRLRRYCALRASLRCLARGGRVVVEDRREPALGFDERPVFAARVVLDLVALDPADAEIMALRVAEIEAGHGSRRPHGEAFGEAHADARLALQQTE